MKWNNYKMLIKEKNILLSFNTFQVIILLIYIINAYKLSFFIYESSIMWDVAPSRGEIVCKGAISALERVSEEKEHFPILVLYYRWQVADDRSICASACPSWATVKTSAVVAPTKGTRIRISISLSSVDETAMFSLLRMIYNIEL